MWKESGDEETYSLLRSFTQGIFLAPYQAPTLPGSGKDRDSAKAQRQVQWVMRGSPEQLSGGREPSNQNSWGANPWQGPGWWEQDPRVQSFGSD